MEESKLSYKQGIAEGFYTIAFGFNPSKRIQNFEKVMADFHFKYNQTAEEIAEIVAMPIYEIEQIIEKFRVVNR